MSEISFRQAFAHLPLVAILRGITPAEIERVGGALVGAGFLIIEVPLTSPEPFRSIDGLVRRFGDAAVIGAGTMRTEADLDRLVDLGGQLMVTPHGDTSLIAAAKRRGLSTMPGVATPTEGFAAMDAGADVLKIFPAGAVPPSLFRAWHTVFAADMALCPSGGVTPEAMGPYLAAGAGGFGLGTQLYKPGMSSVEVAERARAYVEEWRRLGDSDIDPCIPEVPNA